MPYLLRLWLGVSEPVRRRAYALTGFGLMVFKYGVEAFIICTLTSAVFLPWQFLNPVLSVRTEMLQSAPPWVGWALLVSRLTATNVVPAKETSTELASVVSRLTATSPHFGS